MPAALATLTVVRRASPSASRISSAALISLRRVRSWASLLVSGVLVTGPLLSSTDNSSQVESPVTIALGLLCDFSPIVLSVKLRRGLAGRHGWNAAGEGWRHFRWPQCCLSRAAGNGP